MSDNVNIEDDWLAKTGRTGQPDQEFLPAQPKTIDLDALNEYLDRRAAPDQASNREYFHEKGYEFDKIIQSFIKDYMERHAELVAEPGITYVMPRR